MPREILENHRILQGRLAEILYTDDPKTCAEVLDSLWVNDGTACLDGLVALLIYKPTILQILELDKNYIYDDVEFFRIQPSGRIYNKVLGRKAYAILPFVSPYLAAVSFYHTRHGSPGVVLPGVYYALVDQSSLEDAKNPKKKHKKVFAGGSITLEVCGRANIRDIPHCVDLATIELVYRGRGRLALAYSPAAIKVLKSARSLLEEGRESDARVLVRSFLDNLGIGTRGKTTDDLMAMLQRLHQPHRTVLFDWWVSVNRRLPPGFRNSLYKALRKLLRAASVNIGKKYYIMGFSIGTIETSLDSQDITISPVQPPESVEWEVVDNKKLYEIEKLKIAWVLPARRPPRRIELYADAQKRVVPEMHRSVRVARPSRYEAIIDGAAELEYEKDVHSWEAYWRVYLGHGSWKVVFR